MNGATGHLEQLPSGSYRVSVYSGVDPLTGRQLRHRQTAKTEQQARILLLGRLLEQAAAGAPPGSDVKVAEVLAQHLDVAELEPSTRETYEGYLRRTILPALGSMELRKVRGPVLATFYARLRRCGNLGCTGSRSLRTISSRRSSSTAVTSARPGSRSRTRSGTHRVGPAGPVVKPWMTFSAGVAIRMVTGDRRFHDHLCAARLAPDLHPRSYQDERSPFHRGRRSSRSASKSRY
jgi:hypothetical protein